MKILPAATRLITGLSPGAAMAGLLTGYGYVPYDPLCAESCLRSFKSYPLDCTDTAAGHHAHSHGPVTSPECFAGSTPFLTSVVWCMSTECAGFGLAVSELEAFWERWVTGRKAVVPKWTYSQALAQVDPKPPVYQLDVSDTILNVTSIVPSGTYLRQWNVLGMVVRENVLESTYSIVITVVTVGIPVVLTLLSHAPLAGVLLDKIKPYLVYPSLIGRYQVRPLPFYLGNAPTIGQAIYIAIFVVLNFVLATVDYRTAQPSAWFDSQYKEISAYILYRTGTLGFTLLPLVFLFASRNNVLLWLSDWSHSTYLLLHRWVSRVFMLYVVVHSIIGLQVYAHYARTEWWIWGAVATLATVLLAVGSGLYVRAARYELFLISHIVLAVLVVVGCWYHLWGWYASMGISLPDSDTWGYEVWLYFAIAVWSFDRLFRAGRVLKNGARRAQVTDLGGGYVRVDIPCVRWGLAPGLHAYVCFPTLDPLRPWENHPFSVIPTAILPAPAVGCGIIKGEEDKECELGPRLATQADSPGDDRPVGAGITLFVKKAAGLTRRLQAHGSLLALLDGPYTNSRAAGAVLRCDRVLLIAGGIGITSILAWTSRHRNVKLAWSVSESARCLAEAIDLSGVADREVRVGGRFNIDELVHGEAVAGWDRVGVVVSGPGSLCDDVRAAVAAAGRRGRTVFELEVDAYSW